MMGYPPLPGMPPLPPYVPPAYPPMTTQQQPAGHERPPNPEEEPPVKRQKTEEGGEKEEAEKVTAQLLPEAEWRSRISGPVTVKVSVPSVPEKTEWKLHGQIIEVEANISDTVRHLKEKIQEILSMPVNKQKLKARDLGVLNDQKTLAYYNFTQTMEIELAIKERGGRKK
jgi:splicing factor 3A subunit 1